jgi:hypothetical protein
VGTGATAQIENTAQPSPFRVTGAEHHPAQPRLHQRAGTHRAWLEGHQEGAVVEAPIASQSCSLLQGDQFGMAEWALIPFAPVAAPADGAAVAIEQHRRHGYLAGLPHPGCTAQKPLHPLLFQALLMHQRLLHRQLLHPELVTTVGSPLFARQNPDPGCRHNASFQPLPPRRDNGISLFGRLGSSPSARALGRSAAVPGSLRC